MAKVVRELSGGFSIQVYDYRNPNWSGEIDFNFQNAASIQNFNDPYIVGHISVGRWSFNQKDIVMVSFP